MLVGAVHDDAWFLIYLFKGPTIPGNQAVGEFIDFVPSITL